MGVQVPPSAPYLTQVVSNVKSYAIADASVACVSWRTPDARIEKYMVVLFTVIHIAVCLFLIIVVLLQSGQSGDIAAAFGGMGSQTAFGTRTAATMLSKATTWAAVIFMFTSIVLSVFATRHASRSGSVLEGSRPAPTRSAPMQKPSAPAPQPPTR
ncbi:MAG: preprotein translocase subunit SecG [Candidatus Korobacteraceae bacterium]